eukprot:1144733-Pelagomonas_calceolata.AAC.3
MQGQQWHGGAILCLDCHWQPSETKQRHRNLHSISNPAVSTQEHSTTSADAKLLTAGKSANGLNTVWFFQHNRKQHYFLTEQNMRARHQATNRRNCACLPTLDKYPCLPHNRPF